MNEISESEFESSIQKLRNTKSYDTKSHNTKKPSRVPKENKIKEENEDKANVLTILRDKYQCAIHNNRYCYVENDRHLNLTVLHLKLWTTEIVMLNFIFIVFIC